MHCTCLCCSSSYLRSTESISAVVTFGRGYGHCLLDSLPVLLSLGGRIDVSRLRLLFGDDLKADLFRTPEHRLFAAMLIQALSDLFEREDYFDKQDKTIIAATSKWIKSNAMTSPDHITFCQICESFNISPSLMRKKIEEMREVFSNGSSFKIEIRKQSARKRLQAVVRSRTTF